MSNQYDGYKLVTDTYPLPVKATLDDVIGALKEVFRQPFVQSLVIRIGLGDPVTVERYVPADAVREVTEYVETSVLSAIRNADMEGLRSDELPQTVLGKVAAMFYYIQNRRLQPAFVVVGSVSFLLGELSKEVEGTPLASMVADNIEEGIDRILGVSLVEDDDLPPDALIVCGAPTSLAEPIDVKLSVITTMENANEPIRESPDPGS